MKNKLLEGKLSKILFVICIPFIQWVGPAHVIDVVYMDLEGVGTGIVFLIKSILWVLFTFVSSLAVSKYFFNRIYYGLLGNIPLFLAILYILIRMLFY